MIDHVRTAICGLALSSAAIGHAQNIETLPEPASPAGAAAASGQCLSLESAMVLSAQRDPSVTIAEAEQARADADLRQTKSLYRPQVSAFARTGVGDVGLVDSTLQNQVGVRASQRVFDFGDAKFARRAARFGQDASQLETRVAKAQAARATGLAILEALEMSEQILVTAERGTYFEDQLAAIDSLLADGGATRTERANIAGRVADSQAVLLELEFQRDRALHRVVIDTGLDSQLCAPDQEARYLRREIGTFPDQEAAISAAFERNPNIEALADRMRSQEALVKRQKANRFPVINVVGVSAFSSTGALQDLTQQNRVGLDITVPLYSGQAQSAQLDRANAEAAAAAGRLADGQRQLRLDVSIVYRRVESLRAQLVRRQEVAKQSRLRFEAASRQFDFRAITLPELIDARLDYETAQLQEVETRFDLLRQHLELLSLSAQLPI